MQGFEKLAARWLTFRPFKICQPRFSWQVEMSAKRWLAFGQHALAGGQQAPAGKNFERCYSEAQRTRFQTKIIYLSGKKM